MKFKPVRLNLPKKKTLYKKPQQPEAKLQKGWCAWFKARGWYVVEMHASPRFSGFPDLFVTHAEYGARLVELKLPDLVGSRFTDAQWEKFPKLTANGSPIWILTTVCESEYNKLFTQPKGNCAQQMLRKL